MDNPREIITQSPAETAQLGQTLADLVMKREVPRILTLSGELGSGKTTFLQGFAKQLGLTSRLLSPTFIIVRRYQLTKYFSFFYHLDLYRLKSKVELTGLGLAEIFTDPVNLVAVEWADKLGTWLPKSRLDLNFQVLDEEQRKIILKKYA